MHRPNPLRRRPFWVGVVAAAALVTGWTVAVYNLDAYNDSAGAAADLTRVKGELTDQLGTVIRERDELQANKKAAEDAVKAREQSAKQFEDAAKLHEDTVKQQADEVKKREDAVKLREDAVGAQEKVQAQNTITEGNWAVGVDVQPGTYRTKEPVTDHCYWGIYSDPNGDHIVANDIVTGGRPTVTLKGGQFFTTTRCGSWAKV